MCIWENLLSTVCVMIASYHVLVKDTVPFRPYRMSRVTSIFGDPANNFLSIYRGFGELSEKSIWALPSGTVEKLQYRLRIYPGVT